MNYYIDEFSRQRPASSTPPIGSPIIGSYFDGVAQSYRSNHFRPPSPIAPQPQKSNDRPPLLKRHKIDFNPDELIAHLTAGKNQVVIATKDKKILVIDTTSSTQSDYDLARYLGNKFIQAKVHKIFLDPTGKFTLISLTYAADNQPMENLLYVKRIQPLPRLKSHIISAVAWNHPKTTSPESSANSTGTILLGTTKGLILQTELIYSDESKFFPLSPGPIQYVKEVFDVGPEAGAITGIEYHQIPSNSPNERNFVILVSTNNRLYRMVGTVPSNVEPPPLHLIFAQNSNNYKEVPGRFNNAKLDLYYPNLNSPPTRFVWLSEPGVMTGELHSQLASCRASFESNEDITIVPYENRPIDREIPLSSSTPTGMSPPFSGMASYYPDKPISLVVTNFHVIILFRQCLRAICILNEATVYEEHLSNKYGNVQGMCKDLSRNIIWVYCERAVFKYKISNENKDVWRIYLEQKRFDLAKKYSINDETNYDRVICEEAQHYFREKDYEKSAEIFARSKRPFEEVSLMFMEIKNFKGLKKYLTIRLEQFDAVEVMQLVMTLAWLFEIIISSISVLKALPKSDSRESELDSLYTELDHLMENRQIVECISNHSDLFYDIIKNYADLESFVRLAKLVGDNKGVVQYYMDTGQFEKALETMRSNKDPMLYYKHAHILMKRVPRELVDALIEQPNLNPTKLTPILIQENPYFNKCSETIRYLEHCINSLKSNSRVLHNYLFELYARHRDEQTLIDFLEKELNLDLNGEQYCDLDLQLCLRICTELKLVKSCVILYSAMGLFDEALNLALSFDVELAKSIAKKADSDGDQKRLWLSIAESVLTKNRDIQIATDLLRECRSLKIEDILPFFPDYKTIDFFKDAIRQSLREYRDKITSLKDGTYDTIADEIRTEIKAFKNRYSIIKVGQRCEICARSLLSRTFYVFPCGHLFHSDCIIKETIAMVPTYSGNISSECIYCGSLIPNLIQQPPNLESDLLSTDD